MNKLTFCTNNGSNLYFEQGEIDGKVYVFRSDDKNSFGCISPSDFVMLWNLYRYTIENDIQNDFINPHGKNKESD